MNKERKNSEQRRKTGYDSPLGRPRPAPESPLKSQINAKARGTKQKIVLAALHEFAAYGLEGARIDRIAKSAMVNKAMIYYHFDSKDILYKEVLIWFYRKVRRRAEPSVLPVDSLEEVLHTLADIHVESVLESPEIVPLILREMAAPRPDVIDAIAEAFNASGIPAKVVALIKKEVDAGSCRQIDVRQAMVAFISMSLGYFAIAPLINHFLQIEDGRGFIKARPQIIVDIFLNGLKAR
jgi:TetR/AcrR family transcriptional regulator